MDLQRSIVDSGYFSKKTCKNGIRHGHSGSHAGWVKDSDFLRSKKRNRNPPYKRTNEIMNEIIEHIWIYRGGQLDSHKFS